MYTPPFFQADRAAALAFADARGFGTVCAWTGGRPAASPLPFYLDYASDGAPRAAFHVARGNPLAKLADGRSQWLIAVDGPDTYVSPHWYASADQVPTWLYQSVHLTGAVRTMSEAELALHLDALAVKFEGWLAPKVPWQASEVSPGRRGAMMQAIVGLVMSIDDVEGSFKLNQHKSDADHAAVTTALARQSDPAAQQIALTMRGMRPQAFPVDSATLEGNM